MANMKMEQSMNNLKDKLNECDEYLESIKFYMDDLDWSKIPDELDMLNEELSKITGYVYGIWLRH